MKKIYDRNMVEIYEVLPNIYFRKANLEMRGQCNGAYFVGEYGVAAVDAPPEGIEMMAESEELFHKPIRWLFLTHGDGDHVNGLDAFLDLDITIFCHRRLLDDIRLQVSGRKANVIGVEGNLPMQFSGMELDLFTLPDMTHSKWDMYIRLPQTGVLCTGDAVVEYQTAYYHGADLVTWIRSLKKLANEEGTYIFSGHADEPYKYEYMHSFVGHLEAVQRAAAACFAAYAAGEGKEEKERFADVSPKDLAAFVDEYFAKGSEETKGICARAGDEDAQRQVRMALYAMVRKVLR